MVRLNAGMTAVKHATTTSLQPSKSIMLRSSGLILVKKE